MNTAVVDSNGLRHCGLPERAGGRRRAPVVIGFDARPTSRGFAEISAACCWRWFRVVAFFEPTATALCAFLGLELAAAITIVVTARPQSARDNGYKVYGTNAVKSSRPSNARSRATSSGPAGAAGFVPSR